MALDAILFDLDGTLIDTNALHVEAFRQAFNAHGYQVLPDRIAVEMGKGGDTLVPSIVGKQADEKDGDAIRADHPKRFAELAEPRGIRVFPQAVELMAAVRRRGLLVVIATSSGQAQIDTVEKHAGVKLSDVADLIVTADDAEASKPTPDLVVAAVAKAKLSPAQCAMIGDTPYDAQAAKAAGVVTLGVTCGGSAADVLRAAGARRVYADPADLLAHLDEALAAASPGSSHLTGSVMERLMDDALAVARDGMAAGEAPIGCVLARGDGTVIARGFNAFNATGDKTAHAEMVAFRAAAGKVPADAKDLILVSTLEPCVMCTGAAMEAAVDTIVFGLRAPADAGTGRVTPPQSPDVQMPRIVGDVRAKESLALFKAWYDRNVGTPQAAYVGQLLKLHGAA